MSFFTLWYKVGLMQKGADVHMFKAASPGLQNKILEIQDPDDVVDTFLINGNPGMMCRQHFVQIRRERF